MDLADLLDMQYTATRSTKRLYGPGEVPVDWGTEGLTTRLNHFGLDFGLSNGLDDIWIERAEGCFRVLASSRAFLLSADELGAMMGLSTLFGPGCQEMAHHGSDSAVAGKFRRCGDFLWVPLVDADREQIEPVHLMLSRQSRIETLRLISAYDVWWFMMWRMKYTLARL